MDKISQNDSDEFMIIRNKLLNDAAAYENYVGPWTEIIMTSAK